MESANSNILTQKQIGQGLKEALTNGIVNQVTTLAIKDGFFKKRNGQDFISSGIPEDNKTLRDIGLDALADEGLKMLNKQPECC